MFYQNSKLLLNNKYAYRKVVSEVEQVISGWWKMYALMMNYVFISPKFPPHKRQMIIWFLTRLTKYVMPSGPSIHHPSSIHHLPILRLLVHMPDPHTQSQWLAQGQHGSEHTQVGHMNHGATANFIGICMWCARLQCVFWYASRVTPHPTQRNASFPRQPEFKPRCQTRTKARVNHDDMWFRRMCEACNAHEHSPQSVHGKIQIARCPHNARLTRNARRHSPPSPPACWRRGRRVWRF